MNKEDYRVYFDFARKTPVTEEWLMEQEDVRRAAVRDLTWESFKHWCGLLFVWTVILGVCASLLVLGIWAIKTLVQAVTF